MDLEFLEGGKDVWLKVYSIANQDNPGAQLKYKIEKELMTVELPRPLLDRGKIELNIEFINQLGPVAARSGVWDGNYSVSQWFPKLMVYDEKGWALEHNSGYHYMGEFYGDYGSYDVDLIVPASFTLGATGHLNQSETLAGNRKKLSYHADHVRDFAWTADPSFTEKLIQVGKTTIHVLTRNKPTEVIGDYA